MILYSGDITPRRQQWRRRGIVAEENSADAPNARKTDIGRPQEIREARPQGLARRPAGGDPAASGSPDSRTLQESLPQTPEDGTGTQVGLLLYKPVLGGHDHPPSIRNRTRPERNPQRTGAGQAVAQGPGFRAGFLPESRANLPPPCASARRASAAPS